MTPPSNFAQRHGYETEHSDFQSHDHLPTAIRQRIGFMMWEHFSGLSRSEERYLDAVEGALPPSPALLDWRDNIPYRQDDGLNVRTHLASPLLTCDWRLVYTIVERVCEDWGSTGSNRERWFTPDFNRLLRSYRIPWMLQAGWVIPVADYEFADELTFARNAAQDHMSEGVRDHHALVRDALDILYSRSERPADRTAACVHAWGAWKAVTGLASGFGSRDKRAFEWVEEKHPRLAATMATWRPVAENGRHPENGEPPTAEEVRLIVMLCAAVVRFLSPTPNS